MCCWMASRFPVRAASWRLMAGGADLLALGDVGLPHPAIKVSNNRDEASVFMFMVSSSTDGKWES